MTEAQARGAPTSRTEPRKCSTDRHLPPTQSIRDRLFGEPYTYTREGPPRPEPCRSSAGGTSQPAAAATPRRPCSRSRSPGPRRPPRHGSSLQAFRGRHEEGHSGCGPSTRLLGAALFTMDGGVRRCPESAERGAAGPHTRTSLFSEGGGQRCHAPGPADDRLHSGYGLRSFRQGP